jgi:hypothetical protein
VLGISLGKPRERVPSGHLRGTLPHPEPFPPGVSCGAGCPWVRGYRCAYQDQAGNRCGYWCQDHSVFVNGNTWCKRHGNNVKWLTARGGSIFEITQRPAIDDRSPNLVGILVDELDVEVTNHLMTCFGHREGVRVITDTNVRVAAVPKGRVERTPDGPIVLSEGSHVAWARGWGVYSEVGYLTRVILRVTATEPPTTHLYVNGNPIVSRIPDWIANRRAGTNQDEDHARFRAAIMEAIRTSVRVAD